MRWHGNGDWRRSAKRSVDFRPPRDYPRSLISRHRGPVFPLGPAMPLLFYRVRTMKIRNSLKSLKNRHRDCRVIRRRGRTYVINKTNRRFKARQG